MILVLFCIFLQTLCTVIGLDYGTDWIKVSVIKPGGIIETVLNRESKRKTNSVLNIRDGMRTYGVEASTLGTRFPEGTFANLKSLVGKAFDDPVVLEYKKVNSNNLIKSSRNTVAFEHQGQTYELEELIAMLLRHAKKQAEKYTSIKVLGAVITIPPHFSIFERQAILDAADIAELKVFGLIHDETAVAINFAVGKQFQKKEYHMFYDMGAGTTIATLASFHSGSDKKNAGKNLVEMEIKGHVVEEVGGQMIDSRLQNFLAKSFMDQHGSKVSSSIFNNPRAMARFLKEANRCKSILSANQNVLASMENVVDGIDFKVSVSRKELETISADLFAKTTGPIESVLKLSNVSLDDVKSLVLVGGGVRVPAIQKKLKDFVDEQKIARNVDGDEAAVLGAVLHAAKISAQFRLGQTMIIKDLNSKPIQIVYDSENSKKLATGLFTDKSHLGSKKLMTFKRISDFEFHAEYKTDKTTRIATYKVTGLTEGMKKWGEAAAEEPKVKIQIGLTESGLLQVSEAVALFEIRPDPQPKGDSFKDSVMKMFKKSNDSKKEEKEEKEEKEDSKDKPDDDSKEKDEADNEEGKDKKKTEKSPKKDEKPTTTKIVIEKVPLKVEIEFKTIVPLNAEQKMVMKDRLLELDNQDDIRSEREAALNGLESYIYKCKELSWEDDIEEFTKPEELEKLKEVASATSEWLEDHTEHQITIDFTDKKKELHAVAGPIFRRRSEHSQTPIQVENLEAQIKEAFSLRDVLEQKLNDTNISKEEMEKLTHQITSHDEWLQNVVKAQKQLSKSDDPVLLVKDLKQHQKELDAQISQVDPVKRMKSKPKAKKNMPDIDVQEMLKKSKLSKEEMDALVKMAKKNKMNPEDLQASVMKEESSSPKQEDQDHAEL